MATQSLSLEKIRTDTMIIPTYPILNTPARSIDYIEDSLILSVAARDDFGSTAGANQTYITCIRDISNLKARLQSEGRTPAVDESLCRLHQRLFNSFSNTADTNSEPIVECHHRIFHAGFLIYFYRSIWNFPPCEFSQLLDAFFDQVILSELW